MKRNRLTVFIAFGMGVLCSAGTALAAYTTGPSAASVPAGYVACAAERRHPTRSNSPMHPVERRLGASGEEP